MFDKFLVWLDLRQVFVYFFALFLGVFVAWFFPFSANVFAGVVNPFIFVLLYVTFLGVPFSKILLSFRDMKFLVVLLFLNFCVVPVVVWCVSWLVVFDSGLVFGVSLVLLSPCVDYVLVFSRLAGGDWVKLLAVTPVLMLLQIVLLPFYLYVFSLDVVFLIDWLEFVWALVWFILLPLVFAFLTVWFAKFFVFVDKFMFFIEKSMVSLMFFVLLSIVASQFANVWYSFSFIFWAVPVYVLFVLFMVLIGAWVGRLFSFSFSVRRVLIFSCCTRNSLVIFPLTLSLPSVLSFVPAVVILQTFVELVFMVLFVYLMPKIVVE